MAAPTGRQKRRSGRIADATEVRETLTRILRREETDSVVVSRKICSSHYDENGKPVREEELETNIVPVPAKIKDVNKAAELLGKGYGLFTERNQTAAEPVIIWGVDDLA